MQDLASIGYGRSDDNSVPAERNGFSLVVAEHYPMLLDGIEQALASERDFHVLARCARGDEVLRTVHRLQPDILLLDLDIPSVDAFQVLNDIAAAGLRTRVVVLAGRISEHEMLTATRLGVRGILLKSMSRQLLVRCLRKVGLGGTWIEKLSMENAIRHMLHEEEGRRAVAGVLSARELEVLRLVAGGHPNKAIADKLCICEGTVKVHLHHLYEKLNIKSRLALTLFARERGLQPLSSDRAL